MSGRLTRYLFPSYLDPPNRGDRPKDRKRQHKLARSDLMQVCCRAGHLVTLPREIPRVSGSSRVTRGLAIALSWSGDTQRPTDPGSQQACKRVVARSQGAISTWYDVWGRVRIRPAVARPGSIQGRLPSVRPARLVRCGRRTVIDIILGVRVVVSPEQTWMIGQSPRSSRCKVRSRKG